MKTVEFGFAIQVFKYWYPLEKAEGNAIWQILSKYLLSCTKSVHRASLYTF